MPNLSRFFFFNIFLHNLFFTWKKLLYSEFTQTPRPTVARDPTNKKNIKYQTINANFEKSSFAQVSNRVDISSLVIIQSEVDSFGGSNILSRINIQKKIRHSKLS